MFLIAILADWVGAIVGGKKMVGYLGGSILQTCLDSLI